ncbi:MAG: HEAT repeat domain-containing protein [Candidatus Marinimicrobia bacterium]|nr:HEAT repeat domain-containing protein [Candidatus Neomarinimicrobiota bacterium]
MKRIFILTAALLTSYLYAEFTLEEPSRHQDRSFAIVIDRESYGKAKIAVDAYRAAIEKDGLACYLMIEKDEQPNAIKAEVMKLYQAEKAFEGIALVGDVPIPMIRDAQHLCSAFKMDSERFKDFQRSSVASDRFYEDFDLTFKFLKQDTLNPLLYYFSLTSEGPQKIDKEIYSGRIKPPVDTEEKYTLLREYLERIARQKQEIHEIKNMLTFAGHGYHSESLASWEWDLLSLREQFPQLYKSGHEIKNFNHASSNHMKKILLTEIQNPALDMALFHAHGAYDTQYLNGYPLPQNMDGYIESAKLFLRSKIQGAARRKKDLVPLKEYYVNNYGVPIEWMDNALADSMLLADSLLSAGLDIYTSDLKDINIQPKFVMFDQCFNGQFFKTDYISGAYLFNGGNTIAAVANSVNVKQDIWADEFLGLLNKGFRVGHWHQTRTFLESHIIGDPTFHFSEVPSDLIKNLRLNKNEKFWLKQLKSEDPVLRGLAVRKLYECQPEKFIDELINLYNGDSSYIVRLQAVKCLSFTRSKAFEDILLQCASDPSEMIRRITAIWMGKIGREDYLPVLTKMMMYDHSERVARQADESLGLIHPVRAISVVQKECSQMPKIAEPEILEERIVSGLKRDKEWLDEIIHLLQADTTDKARKGNLRTLRNYSFHQAVAEVCNFVLDKKTDPDTRIVGVEALGWFTFSKEREYILETCGQLITQKDLSAELREESVKTIKRLKEGSNDPVTP